MDRRTRRAMLASIGAGVFGASAGCLSPGTTSPATRDTGVPAAEAEHPPVDPVFADVYDATIDSVTLVRVFGIEDPMDEDEEQRGQGSGFLYDDTHVVTNDHVVAPGEGVDLQYTTGEWTETTVVGTDPRSDLAVLEVDYAPESATALPLAEESPAPGQNVLAVGNPLGLEGSVSHGIVSGVDREIFSPLTGVSIPNAVQTDAALNPGNSGGPLVDLEGEVVGVISAGGPNVGFAISAALSRRVLPALIEDGEFTHAFLGTSTVSVDPLVARENGIDEPTGVLVVEVTEDGPTADVLRGSDDRVQARGEAIPVGGDVIRAVDDRPIPDQQALSAWLSLEASPGETVDVEIVRDGNSETLEVTLGERPDPS
ncbi:S1C family serine protease [Natrialbaceae archaeon A-gly3]